MHDTTRLNCRMGAFAMIAAVLLLGAAAPAVATDGEPTTIFELTVDVSPGDPASETGTLDVEQQYHDVDVSVDCGGDPVGELVLLRDEPDAVRGGHAVCAAWGQAAGGHVFWSPGTYDTVLNVAGSGTFHVTVTGYPS